MRSTTATKVWIDIAASGHVVVRRSECASGWLPCYAVSSVKEANDLIVFACVLTRDNSGYAMPNFKEGSLDSLTAATERFKTLHETMLKRRAERAAQ